ncbi:hypothetical protein OUZ56_027091 [Daphnia magna]|nr:hypothetical protein OUZ56_027091 [Daphnia magna]
MGLTRGAAQAGQKGGRAGEAARTHGRGSHIFHNPTSIGSNSSPSLHHPEGSEISVGDDGSEQPMESLSLIDAVMPDVVASRQQQTQNNQKSQVVKTEPPNSNGDEPMHSYRWEEETGVEIPASKSTVLRHTNEVNAIKWDPQAGLLSRGNCYTATKELEAFLKFAGILGAIKLEQVLLTEV